MNTHTICNITIILFLKNFIFRSVKVINIPVSSSSISDGKHSERNFRWNIRYHSVSFEYLEHNKFDTRLYLKVFFCVLIDISWAQVHKKYLKNWKFTYLERLDYIYNIPCPKCHLIVWTDQLVNCKWGDFTSVVKFHHVNNVGVARAVLKTPL